MAEKDFFNILSMSRDQVRVRETFIEEVTTEMDKRTRLHLKMLMRQMDIQLAIAQQLTMIAQHLGEIVAKSKTDVAE